MDSLLETQRRQHEERERLVDTMVREWLHDKKSNKERINSEHRLKMLLERYTDSTQRLLSAYQDKDGRRAGEISAVGGPNEFGEFYNRLKELKDAHRRDPEAIAVPLSVEFAELVELVEDPDRVELDMIEFTDEEAYGRFLDLHQQYYKFLNLKGLPKTDYVSYLSALTALPDIPRETKKTGEYRRYLSSLKEYLVDFLRRTRPLMDVEAELTKAESEFAAAWASGSVPGWGKEATGALAHTGAYLDLSPFNSAAELEGLGLDRLKSALLALGLKCGGTLSERAARLFQTKGRKLEELPPELFAGKKKKRAAGEAAEASKEEGKSEAERSRALASAEAVVLALLGQLAEERAGTIENVQRKQARTAGEEEEEAGETEAAAVSDEEVDDDVPYNPKNLPLGWDGKPIPYWLYKLHGLNISYNCEICGNQSYKGPKAFQLHFSEWRHSHGMRCLGIPNTAHFANITKISDAVDLWAVIREQKEAKRWAPEAEEEFEDSQGNVVTKKTYEDLKRQGLL